MYTIFFSKTVQKKGLSILSRTDNGKSCTLEECNSSVLASSNRDQCLGMACSAADTTDENANCIDKCTKGAQVACAASMKEVCSSGSTSCGACISTHTSDGSGGCVDKCTTDAQSACANAKKESCSSGTSSCGGCLEDYLLGITDVCVLSSVLKEQGWVAFEMMVDLNPDLASLGSNDVKLLKESAVESVVQAVDDADVFSAADVAAVELVEEQNARLRSRRNDGASAITATVIFSANATATPCGLAGLLDDAIAAGDFVVVANVGGVATAGAIAKAPTHSGCNDKNVGTLSTSLGNVVAEIIKFVMPVEGTVFIALLIVAFLVIGTSFVFKRSGSKRRGSQVAPSTDQTPSEEGTFPNDAEGEGTGRDGEDGEDGEEEKDAVATSPQPQATDYASLPPPMLGNVSSSLLLPPIGNYK